MNEKYAIAKYSFGWAIYDKEAFDKRANEKDEFGNQMWDMDFFAPVIGIFYKDEKTAEKMCRKLNNGELKIVGFWILKELKKTKLWKDD